MCCSRKCKLIEEMLERGLNKSEPGLFRPLSFKIMQNPPTHPHQTFLSTCIGTVRFLSTSLGCNYWGT
jgi:hypothetical protein